MGFVGVAPGPGRSVRALDEGRCVLRVSVLTRTITPAQDTIVHTSGALSISRVHARRVASEGGGQVNTGRRRPRRGGNTINVTVPTAPLPVRVPTRGRLPPIGRLRGPGST